MPSPIIVFDLDGTLVDTAPDLIDSLNHSLLSGGAQAADETVFRQYAGMGGRVMIERAYAAQSMPLVVTEHERMIGVFLEHYGANIPGRSQPYPDVIDTLDRLDTAGYLLAVCTNKPERFARDLLAGLGMAASFAAICGADTFAFRKPDSRHLLETIRLAGGDKDRALMVGDSRTDIDTAKAAGIPVVAVDYGYTDVHVGQFEPSVVISRFDALTVELCGSLIAAARG